MSTSSFSGDLRAVAAVAGASHEQIAQHAFNAAEFNGFDVARTTKYNLNRLEGLRLITVEEHEQLNKIADGLQSRSDVSALADGIQQKTDASPVAVALAGIAAASRSIRGVDAGAVALSGALVGALITFGSEDVLHGANDAASGKALTCILAAVGGAAASVTDAVIGARTGS